MDTKRTRWDTPVLDPSALFDLYEALEALVTEHFAPKYAPLDVRLDQWNKAVTALKKARGD